MKRYRPHILVLCILAATALTGMHRTLQNALTDTRFGWSQRPASGARVIVVDGDGASANVRIGG